MFILTQTFFLLRKGSYFNNGLSTKGLRTETQVMIRHNQKSVISSLKGCYVALYECKLSNSQLQNMELKKIAKKRKSVKLKIRNCKDLSNRTDIRQKNVEREDESSQEEIMDFLKSFEGSSRFKIENRGGGVRDAYFSEF